jgi:hypothetical protein
MTDLPSAVRDMDRSDVQNDDDDDDDDPEVLNSGLAFFGSIPFHCGVC